MDDELVEAVPRGPASAPDRVGARHVSLPGQTVTPRTRSGGAVLPRTRRSDRGGPGTARTCADVRPARPPGHGGRVRILVTGPTGNVGSALVRALLADPDVEEVVGVARRLPGHLGRAVVAGHVGAGATCRTRRAGRSSPRPPAAATSSSTWPGRCTPTRDPALLRAGQHRRHHPGRRGRARRRGAAPGPHQQRGRLQPGPQGPPGRRELADRRDQRVALQPAEGGLRAAARRRRALAAPTSSSPGSGPRPSCSAGAGRRARPLRPRPPGAALDRRPAHPAGASRCRSSCAPRSCTPRTWPRRSGSRCTPARRAGSTSPTSPCSAPTTSPARSAPGGPCPCTPAWSAGAMDLSWHLRLQPLDPGWFDLGRWTPAHGHRPARRARLDPGPPRRRGARRGASPRSGTRPATRAARSCSPAADRRPRADGPGRRRPQPSGSPRTGPSGRERHPPQVHLAGAVRGVPGVEGDDVRAVRCHDEAVVAGARAGRSGRC